MSHLADKRSAMGIALASLALLLAGCGGDDTDEDGPAAGPDASTSAPPPAPAGGAPAAGGEGDGRPDPEPRAEEGDGGGPAEPAEKPLPSGVKRDAAAGAEEAYTAYVEAINGRDGEALCALLPDDALRTLRPPVDRGSCAESLTASIGYEDPRGYPVWERTILTGIESVSVGDDPGTVRLTAATLTELEDREPSVESDVAYLERTGGGWRLSQPTAVLYRAIGRPELPPSVIAPPTS